MPLVDTLAQREVVPGDFAQNGTETGSPGPGTTAGSVVVLQHGGRRLRVVQSLLAFALLATGATGMWFYLQSRAIEPAPVTSSGLASAPESDDTQPQSSDLEITLAADMAQRSNLQTGQVVNRPLTTATRVPGTIQPNAYREVHVTPLVGGVLTKTFVELGNRVKRGAPLAKVFSSELAEAQTQYLSMRAELEAEHKKLKRTEELNAIGAASSQELEEVQASHAVHEAHVLAARQRLVLLGISENQITRLESTRQVNSEIVVPAPIDGVVVARMANLGQVVTTGQELFTVTDLSTVWVIADIFEKDFAVVREGAKATITTPAYPGTVYQGIVSYIDPQIDPQTRTTKVRVQVANPPVALRIGMYVDVSFTTASGESVAVVPGGAIQSLGTRQVVYLPVENDENRFVQRTVKLRQSANGDYGVVEGLRAGDTVVTEGSFFLRAESLKQQPAQ